MIPAPDRDVLSDKQQKMEWAIPVFLFFIIFFRQQKAKGGGCADFEDDSTFTNAASMGYFGLGIFN